jgi:glycine dehydrogenase subunit 1
MAELAQLNFDKAAYAVEQLTTIPGVRLSYPNALFFNECTLTLPCDATSVTTALLERGFAAGMPLEGNRLVVTVTEKRTKAEIDGLVAALKEVLCN